MYGAFLSLSNFTHAEPKPSVEIFSSNNASTINLEEAYKRLTGKAQLALEDTVVTILQKNHIEQGRFENILGIYQMTADNTTVFYTSPEQSFSNAQIFSIANQLANALNQESVAVFIPSKNTSISEITITFETQPSINEVMKLLHEKLPADYSQAFSLHLVNDHCGHKQPKVRSVEWIGEKINISKIKRAFPRESMTYQLGRSYLIYKTGSVKLL